MLTRQMLARQPVSEMKRGQSGGCAARPSPNEGHGNGVFRPLRRVRRYSYTLHQRSIMARSSAARSSSARHSKTPAKSSRAKPAPRAKQAQAASSSATTETTDEAQPAPTARRTTLRMSEEDLQHVWKTYKKTQDQNLRDVLLECHLPLVRMIAERLLQTLPKSIELDDLTSAGVFRPDGCDRRLRPESRHQVPNLLHDSNSRLDS